MFCAAFEKAVKTAVNAADNTVVLIYDNTPFTTPGKTTKYVSISVNFNRSTLQNMGGASDFYSGVISCRIYVPKAAGTSVLSAIGEAVIDGLTSVNAFRLHRFLQLRPPCPRHHRAHSTGS